MKSAPVAHTLWACLWLLPIASASVSAQHVQEHSPYAHTHSAEIPSLSEEEVRALRDGEGMGKRHDEAGLRRASRANAYTSPAGSSLTSSARRVMVSRTRTPSPRVRPACEPAPRGSDPSPEPSKRCARRPRRPSRSRRALPGRSDAHRRPTRRATRAPACAAPTGRCREIPPRVEPLRRKLAVQKTRTCVTLSRRSHRP